MSEHARGFVRRREPAKAQPASPLSRLLAAGLFRPTLPANALIPAIGALGALVMPYNLYFASAVVTSRWAAWRTARQASAEPVGAASGSWLAACTHCCPL